MVSDFNNYATPCIMSIRYKQNIRFYLTVSNISDFLSLCKSEMFLVIISTTLYKYIGYNSIFIAFYDIICKKKVNKFY